MGKAGGASICRRAGEVATCVGEMRVGAEDVVVGARVLLGLSSESELSSCEDMRSSKMMSHATKKAPDDMS
jgi:hypothetical protein